MSVVNKNIGQWPYIPECAFLYFPDENGIKQGTGESQWRKIFEGDVQYDQFQLSRLEQLIKKLQSQKVEPHPWFDHANKLRFLQANKFKISETIKPMRQAINWRNSTFPLVINDQIRNKLNEGSMYICGRDRQYRPIIVVQVSKIKKYNENTIPVMLSAILQFTINEMMIPGQIQNYVMLVNLEDVGISDRNSVSKIMSFNSNTYRGRLYTMYLLNAPFFLSAGWEGFASKIVSENTLKKIKLTRKSVHENMWTHINKDHVQLKYGGTMSNIVSQFWPPALLLCNREQKQAKHITKQQYDTRYQSGAFKNSKTKYSLLISQNVLKSMTSVRDSVRDSRLRYFQEQSAVDEVQKDRDIRDEIQIPITKRQFKLFFQDPKYLQMMQFLRPRHRL